MSVNITINIQSNEAGHFTDLENRVLDSLSRSLRVIEGNGGLGPEVAAKAQAASGSALVVSAKTKAELKAEAKAAQLVAEAAGNDGSDTLEQAVAQATTLVADGKTAKVKEALAAAGAKRVSELKGSAIAVFLGALDG